MTFKRYVDVTFCQAIRCLGIVIKVIIRSYSRLHPAMRAFSYLCSHFSVGTHHSVSVPNLVSPIFNDGVDASTFRSWTLPILLFKMAFSQRRVYSSRFGLDCDNCSFISGRILSR